MARRVLASLILVTCLLGVQGSAGAAPRTVAWPGSSASPLTRDHASDGRVPTGAAPATTSAAAAPQTSSANWLAGVDVSNWQGAIDWAKVKGAGIQFAIALIVFVLAGSWLDGRFGTSPAFILAGVIVGGGASFYSFYRKISAAQRKDDAIRRKRAGRE